MRAYLIPVILAAGALCSSALASTLAPRFPLDFAQPLPVATAWGGAGALAWSLLACTLMGASAIWFRMIDEPPALRTTLIVSALSLCASLLWRPIFSSDVYAYAAYGEMARMGLDPYTHHPGLADPIVRAAQWQWSGSLPVCVYGEAFVALARAIVTLAAVYGTATTLIVFRIVACFALLGCALLMKRRAAFFFVCNPIVIYACAEGHNDILMIAAALAGVALARRAPFAGAVVIAASAAIKAPGIAAGAAFAVWRSIEGSGARRTIAGTLVGAAVALAASFRLVTDGLRTVAAHGTYHAFASVQALSPLLALAIAVAIALRLRSFAQSYDRIVAIGLILWLLIPNPYAWYAIWILAPAAFAGDRRIAATTTWLAAVTALRYLPDAAGAPPSWAEALSGLAAAGAYLPLVQAPARRYAILKDP